MTSMFVSFPLCYVKGLVLGSRTGFFDNSIIVLWLHTAPKALHEMKEESVPWGVQWNWDIQAYMCLIISCILVDITRCTVYITHLPAFIHASLHKATPWIATKMFTSIITLPASSAAIRTIVILQSEARILAEVLPSTQIEYIYMTDYITIYIIPR